MLRALVLLLIVANVAAWAWYDGRLAPYLATAAGEDDRRVHVQHHPERLMVMAPPAVPGNAPAMQAGPLADPPANTQPGLPGGDAAEGVGAACLQAGPFTPAEQAAVADDLSRRLPAASWTAQQVASLPGLWLLYMGPFADEEALQRKLSELRRIRNLAFEEVRSPASLVPGVSLGRYTQQEQAEAALENLRMRGIRTARIVTLRPASVQSIIRVAQATADMRQQLEALTLPAGRAFGPCPQATGG